jgi:hypothetical protein
MWGQKYRLCNTDNMGIYLLLFYYLKLVGFGPVFLGSLKRQTGATRPSHRSFAALPPKNKQFPETKSFPSGPNSGRQGRISFYWAKLHPNELHCILLSYDAPSWATRHPYELCCTLLSYAAPSSYAAFNWATPHPIWATLHPKSYTAPSELSCTLLSYAAPFWATLHPIWFMLRPKSFAAPFG